MKRISLVSIAAVMTFVVGCTQSNIQSAEVSTTEISVVESTQDEKITEEQAVKIAQADLAVNETVINYDEPLVTTEVITDDRFIAKVDDSLDLNGKEVYVITFDTTYDEVLGPIIYYIGLYDGQIYGSVYRE